MKSGIILSIIIVLLVLIVGGVFIYTTYQNNKKTYENSNSSNIIPVSLNQEVTLYPNKSLEIKDVNLIITLDRFQEGSLDSKYVIFKAKYNDLYFNLGFDRNIGKYYINVTQTDYNTYAKIKIQENKKPTCQEGYTSVAVPGLFPPEEPTPYYCQTNKTWEEFGICNYSIKCPNNFSCTSRIDFPTDFRCIPYGAYSMDCGCSPYDQNNTPACWCS